MQEAWEYIKEENFQMKGPEKEERKRIRIRTIEKKGEKGMCISLCKNLSSCRPEENINTT